MKKKSHALGILFQINSLETAMGMGRFTCLGTQILETTSPTIRVQRLKKFNIEKYLLMTLTSSRVAYE